MRLFIIGPRWVGEWTEGVGRAAVALGHTAATFYYRSDGLGGLRNKVDRSLPPAFNKAFRGVAFQLKRIRDNFMNRRLVQAVRTFQPDFIVVLKGESILRETLVTMRAQNIPLISWWVDDPFRFPTLLQNFELFDLVCMFDKECVAKINSRNIKHVIYLPCACDETTFYPLTINPSDYPAFNCTVGFIATYYPGRAALLSQMKGLDVGLWGGGWEAAHEELCELPPGSWRDQSITARDAAKVYNLAEICPNVHHPQTYIGGLNTRTFEILASGGFELVDNVPGLEESFEVDREIVVYSSLSNFRELTDYYLAHPAERKAIIKRGRDRVLRDHTYKQRLEVITKVLGVL